MTWHEKGLVLPYRYACTEFPGMEGCPGYLVADTQEELWRLIALHAEIAHSEDPKQWTPDEKRQISDLIRPS